ncbi:transcriptional regulator [Pseudomonas sp. NFX224]|uniref:transcriptional regulator n=1 Tax=Pseudomonas sp. NFX224 TaxID=3402862 RepID=UPI003AFA882E
MSEANVQVGVQRRGEEKFICRAMGDAGLKRCVYPSTLRQKLYLSLTQARLAELAGLTRQKVIAVEKGTLSVAMVAYARVLGALDCEFAVTPAAMPTLEELGDLFE